MNTSIQNTTTSAPSAEPREAHQRAGSKVQTKTQSRVAYRYKPAGYVEALHPLLSAAVYLSPVSTKPHALGYAGTAGRPAFNYTFSSVEHRDTYVASWLAGLSAKKARKEAAALARRTFAHSFKVGDILMSTWGWEQTNVDFYQVTRVAGQSVQLRRIGAEITARGDMSGLASGRKDAFLYDSEPRTHRVTSNRISLNSYSSAGLWDGQPVAFTTYA